MDILKALTEEFSLKPFQVENTVKLIDEGNTIPFIARYRKEATGSLDDQVLRELDERLKYLRNMDETREKMSLTIFTDPTRKSAKRGRALQRKKGLSPWQS